MTSFVQVINIAPKRVYGNSVCIKGMRSFLLQSNKARQNSRCVWKLEAGGAVSQTMLGYIAKEEDFGGVSDGLFPRSNITQENKLVVQKVCT